MMMDDYITISDDEDVQLIKHVVNLEPIIVDLTKNDDVSSQQATNGTSDDENKRPSPQSSPNVSNHQFCPFKTPAGSQAKSSEPSQPTPDTRPPPPPPPQTDHQNIFRPAPQPAPNLSKTQFFSFKPSNGSQEKPPQPHPETRPPPQTNHQNLFKAASQSSSSSSSQQPSPSKSPAAPQERSSQPPQQQPKPPPDTKPSPPQTDHRNIFRPAPHSFDQQNQQQTQQQPQTQPHRQPQPQQQQDYPQPQQHYPQPQQQNLQPQQQQQQQRLNPPSPQKQTIADLEAQKELGNQKYRNNQFDDAIRIYRGAIALAKKLNHTKMSAMLHFNLAMTYYKVSSFDQAADECANAVKYDPKYLKAHLKRAEIYTRQYKFEEAVICYEYICEIEPDHARLLQKAKELASSKKINKKDFYQILGLHPNFTREDLKKAYRQKALSHHPDRHSDADIVTRRIEEKRFKDASEAYSFLQQRHGYLR